MLELVDGYNLDKIVSYEFTKTSNKKRSFSELVFKTTMQQFAFATDEEFYNQFVEAVNNAI